MKSATLLLLALVASTAHAQPSGAQAETLFRQGKDLMAKGKIAEACAAFDASQKLDPTISTLLNQAACREKNEQFATAWGLFLEAERQTRTATDTATQQLHQVAATKAAKLEPRLSTLTLNIPAESRVGGLQVMRAGEVVDPGAWNKALPVDGGTYRIAASAPGNAEWSTTITIANERDSKTIEIPKLKAAAIEPRPARPQPVASTTRSEPRESSRSRILPYVLGGGAVALAGGAIGFELWARSTYDKSKTEMDNAKQDSLWHSANTRRYIAGGLGIAALASAGVAVWLYVRDSRSETPPTHAARVQIAPAVASDRAGLFLIGVY
jgi:hypothetical protein